MRKFHSLGDAIDHFTSRDQESVDWSARLTDEAFGVLCSAFPNMSRNRIRVLHYPDYFAFTAAGDHIFLTRSLLELCRSVDMAAFAIAHEIAHHELGHLPNVSEGANGRIKIAMLQLRGVLTPFARARREVEADLFAVDMCERAGLSGKKCVRLFQILEKSALDKGYFGSVFGSDAFYCTEMSSIERRRKIGLYLLRHVNYPFRVRRILAEQHIGVRNPIQVFLN